MEAIATGDLPSRVSNDRVVGGIEYPWSSPFIIGTIVIAVVGLIGFV